MFSKACEYGIKATLYIARQSEEGKRVKLGEIAESIDSPQAFTAKILQQLARNKIIKSIKGPGGGFEMDKKILKKITLDEIVTTIDGDSIYQGCGLGLEQCNEEAPCPVHNQFKAVKEKLRVMLETTTVKDLTMGLESGLTHLR